MSPVSARDLWPDVIKAAFQLVHIPPAIVDIAVQLKSGLAPDPASAAAKRAIEDHRNLVENEFRQLSAEDRASVESLTRSVLVGALDDYEVLSLILEDSTRLPWLLAGRVPSGEPASEDSRNYFRSLLDVVCVAISAIVRPDDPQTRALHAGVGQILRSLKDLADVGGLAIGESSAARAVEASELTAASLAAVLLAGAKTLPEVERLEYLASENGAILDHFPLAVLGEGGSGKSVIATQLFAHYAAQEHGPTLFVPCSQIPASQDVSSLEAIDAALARGLGQFDVRMSHIIEGVPGVTLIIDTLDLVLSEDNADNLAELILLLAGQCQLILTCRSREWDDFLAGDERLEVYSTELPKLTLKQVVAWAALYVEQRLCAAPEGAGFLESLRIALRKTGAGDLFGSPVRLAMTCDIYAATGALPEDLTVTSLYEAYWDAKVDRDRRGRRGKHARPRGNAARELAETIWDSSERRFTEFVAIDIRQPGLISLVSEGVVRTVGEKAGFFHQTFAEYAVARHLSGQTHPSQLQRLRVGLDRGSASEWGIVTHLMMLSLDDRAFRDVAALLPRATPEGLRLLLRATVSRNDSTLLADVVSEEAVQHGENLAASLDVLVSSSTEICNLLTPLVVHLAAQESGRTRFLGSLARLLERATAPEKTDWLATAAQLVLKHPAATAQGDLVMLFDNTLGRSPASYNPEHAMFLYEHLPPGARANLASSFVHQPSDRLHVFLEVALRHTAPLKALESLLAIAKRAHDHASTRQQLGWNSWRGLLDSEYPDGWRMIQTTLVGQLLSEEQLDELVGALIESSLRHRKEYTDVGTISARNHPVPMARAVCAAAAPSEQAAASSLARVARELSEYDVNKLELSEALRPLRQMSPLEVEPALASLAAREPRLVERGISELLSQSRSAQESDQLRVVRRTWDAYFQSFSLMDVSRFEYELGASLGARTPRERERLARLSARLCPISASARDAVTALYMDKGEAYLAGQAAKVLLQWAGEPQLESHAEWLVALLRSPHGNPVAVAALLLSQNRISPTISDESVEVIVSRTLRVVESREDAQVLEALLGLLACLARLPRSPLNIESVKVLIAALWSPLATWRDEAYPRDSRFPGLYQQLNFAITGVAFPMFSEDEIGEELNRLVLGLDAGAIGVQPRRALANSLIVATNRYPLLWTRIDSCWSAASSQNKLAMAEWITHGKVPGREKIALSMARRRDCPPFVAHYIHKYLES